MLFRTLDITEIVWDVVIVVRIVVPPKVLSILGKDILSL
jgi:hypothetical protein